MTLLEIRKYLEAQDIKNDKKEYLLISKDQYNKMIALLRKAYKNNIEK